MKILEILKGVDLVIADIQVNLGCLLYTSDAADD